MSTGESDQNPRPYKRTSVRFQPDEGVFALIDTKAEAEEFNPTIPALVFSEAHKGCGLVVLANEALQVGAIIRTQVGNLSPMKSEIRWREQLDPNVIKIGVMFLE